MLHAFVSLPEVEHFVAAYLRITMRSTHDRPRVFVYADTFDHFEYRPVLRVRVKLAGGGVPPVPAHNIATRLRQCVPSHNVIVDYDPWRLPFSEPRFIGWEVGHAT